MGSSRTRSSGRSSIMSMWSDHGPAGTDPAILTLEELIAIRPPYVRGPFPAGRRGPLGERPGRGRAQSLDFDGIGPYMPGDDVRWIDWRATARSDRMQVKRFAAQSQRARVVVVELNAALHFGTRRRPMAKTATLVAARLVWESLTLNEAVGLVLPDMAAETLYPRRGSKHALRLLTALLACYRHSESLAVTEVTEPLRRGATLVRHGDEVCVVSEFSEPLGPLIDSARALSEHRSLHAYVIEDPMVRRDVPAGHYPAQGEPAPERRIFAIDRQASRRTAATAASLSGDRRRRLIDGGWHVVHALDWLPETSR